FRVLGDIAIAPETATVRVTGHATFVVTDAGVPITNVRWAVNGLPGGDPALGTISADGVYMAPPVITMPPVVTVTATHKDEASLSESATVTVLPALNLFISSRQERIVTMSPPLTQDRRLG